MSWQRRLGLVSDRTETAALKAEVSALQVALDRCRSIAGYCERRRRNIMFGVAAVGLALGIALGAGLGHVREGLTGVARALTSAPSAADVDAAYAASRKGKYVTALRLARPLAEEGDARAQSLLGSAYLNGRGVPHSDEEALRWFQLAADQGDADAQFQVGVMHDEGRIVPQDHAEAASWYARAAARGNAQAQYNLGLAYAKGEGVDQDNVRAHMWLNLAASRFAASDSFSRGAVAGRSRDVVAGKMTRDEVVEAQRMAREWKPEGGRPTSLLTRP
jgi:hypothetical protein